MRLTRTAFGVAIVAAVLFSCPAWAQQRTTGQSTGTGSVPYSSPSGGSTSRSSPGTSQPSRPGYPYPGYGWYGPWGPYYYGYPQVGPYAYPYPSVSPNTLYGPEAIQRSLGWDTSNPQPGQPAQPATPRTPAPQPAAESNTASETSEALSTARRLMGLGDTQFSNQRYSEAAQRYKKATQTAPSLAEPFFHLAYADVAVGLYEPAAKAMKHGLMLAPDWPSSGFTNNELYGKNRVAKTAHMEKLAKAATAHDDNADLLFLLGVYLYFDGQPDRAAPFFQRAAQLGGDGQHLKAFQK